MDRGNSSLGLYGLAAMTHPLCVVGALRCTAMHRDARVSVG